MDKTNRYKISFVLALCGLGVWLLIMSMTDRREAWDSPVFWTIGLPALLLMNAVAGFIEPDRIILKGIFSVCLQPVAMMVKSGEVGSMFLPGLILMLVQGLFFSIGGGIGALIKKRIIYAQAPAAGRVSRKGAGGVIVK